MAKTVLKDKAYTIYYTVVVLIVVKFHLISVLIHLIIFNKKNY